MSRPVREESVRAALADAASNAERLKEASSDPDVASLADSVQVALNMLVESVGECEVEVPFASIQMVRRPDGSREWCCNHDPAHCDPA